MTERRPTAANPLVTTCDPVPGFAPGVGRYVAQLTEIRGKLLREVERLTPAQLSYAMDAETESIGTQLLHVAAVEWSWIFQDIFGRPDDDFQGWEEAFPIRVGAPQASGKPLAFYTEKLAAVRAQVLDALRGMSEDDLARLVGEGPVGEGEESRSRLYTIDWILFHLVEHEAHHVGQVELLRRLLPTSLSAS
jgi:uncharacterized damage-inducible protein DinB